MCYLFASWAYWVHFRLNTRSRKLRRVYSDIKEITVTPTDLSVSHSNDNSNIPMTIVIATNLRGTFTYVGASAVDQKVKNLPAIQSTWVWSLGQEDPLKKGMATHFRFLAWRSLWTEEPGRLQSMGWQKVRHDWAANTSHMLLFLFFTAMWEKYRPHFMMHTLRFREPAQDFKANKLWK